MSNDHSIRGHLLDALEELKYIIHSIFLHIRHFLTREHVYFVKDGEIQANAYTEMGYDSICCLICGDILMRYN